MQTPAIHAAVRESHRIAMHYEALHEVFGARLAALSRANQLISCEQSGCADLSRLFEQELPAM